MKKRLGMIVFVIVCLLAGCQEEQEVTVYINGVEITGTHTLKEHGLQLATKDNHWLQVNYPNETTISIQKIEKDYQIIREKWSEDKALVRYVMLPKDFYYFSSRTKEGQLWVDAKNYPKGWVVTVTDYAIADISMEIIPDEDYLKGFDDEMYEYGLYQDTFLDGLPLPSPKNVEIVDYPNGHVDMDKIRHYSIKIEF